MNRRVAVLLVICGTAWTVRAQSPEIVSSPESVPVEPQDSSVSAQATKPRLSVSLASAAPRLSANWPAKATGVTVSVAAVVAAASPAVSPDARAACAAAGGAVVFTIDPDYSSKLPYNIESTPTTWTYKLDSKYATPVSGPVKIKFVATAVCNGGGAVVGAPDTAKGTLTLMISVDPCASCVSGCKTGPGGTTCDVYAGHCPPSWPNANAFTGVGWSMSLHFFPKSGQSLCNNQAFGSHATKIGTAADQLLKDMFIASGRAASKRYGDSPPTSVLVGGAPAVICREPTQIGKSYGIVQFYLDAHPIRTKDLKKLKMDLQKNWNYRNGCPSIFPENTDPKIKAVLVAFCERMGAPGFPIEWAGVCVKDANPNAKYQIDAPIEKACFPVDALVTLMDPATGGVTRRARMDELRIGDAVECLMPAARRGPGLFRDNEQRYVRGVCHVFNYHDVDADSTHSFVALHYTDAAGRPAKLRATKEHVVYVAPTNLGAADGDDDSGAATVTELPPGGFGRRADMVAVGDFLAVKGKEEGSFFYARIEAITREDHRGAYAPLLTHAGLPIVDGAAAFAWAHLPERDPHPAQNLGEFYRHIRLVKDFNDSLASGCAGAACPCLDAPDDAGRPCVRLGDRLADLPAGASDFAERTIDVWQRASSEGRTFWDYERGIKLGRFWEASRLTQWAAVNLLRLKPHTFALWATDFLMVKPKDGTIGFEPDGNWAPALPASS